MTSIAKITSRDLTDYTIYFLILQRLNCVLYDGRNVKLTNPEEENFTAKFGHERVEFNRIDYFEFEKNGNEFE